jgi:predicted RND superfamily exporter protein
VEDARDCPRYHVFILSRIREAHDRGMSTEDAIEQGIKTTAGTVTSAALVMVGVFSIFATLPILDMKEMGIGLATAVLIDATIVRGVLLPASMKLLGDWNWYLPNWAALAAQARAPRRVDRPTSTGRCLTIHRPNRKTESRPLHVARIPLCGSTCHHHGPARP